MADIINSDNGAVSGSAGIKINSDGTGALQIQTVNTAAITINANQYVTFNSNAAVTVPVGTGAQRPAAPVVGQMRYNTSNSTFEGYANTSWVNIGAPPTPAQVSDANNTATGYFAIPIGTTLQRPASPPLGAMRWNSNSAAMEVFVGSNTWSNVAASNGIAYPVTYLVVAGGGAGGWGSYSGGGGGAGGLLTNVLNVIPGTSYNIVIGSGGAGVSGAYGTNGTNTTFSSITALGGGAGGAWSGNNGFAGGSGGGSGATSAGGFGSLSTGGAGTTGQGFSGGGGYYGGPSPGGISAGGGGGAAGPGGTGGYGNGSASGRGGAAASYDISGIPTQYAGGGGAGGGAFAPWLTYGGGGGGGGAGPGAVIGGIGTSAMNNSGSGGGGAGTDTGNGTNYAGGNGGSGLVVIRYPGLPRGTGGVITSTGTYTIHTFYSSSTYVA